MKTWKASNPPTPACQGSPGCETGNGSPPLPPQGDHFSQKMVGFRWFPFAVRWFPLAVRSPSVGRAFVCTNRPLARIEALKR